MSVLKVEFPFPRFTDVDGDPLENGYIYIGTAGLDPESNAIQAYWDEALSQPATQPIRTPRRLRLKRGQCVEAVTSMLPTTV